MSREPPIFYEKKPTEYGEGSEHEKICIQHEKSATEHKKSPTEHKEGWQHEKLISHI